MAKISFLIPFRIEKNREDLLQRYLDSLLDKCYDPNNIEILIKLDSDQNIESTLKLIEKYQDQISIKHMVSSKGDGYRHLGLFNTELLFLSDPKSKLISTQSVDLIFKKKDFDKLLLQKATKYKDEIFVFHTITLPNFDTDITTINDAVQRPDNFPIWSRKWVEIQGHFGYNSSIDGYTQLTEFFLYKEYDIDRRIDISKHKIYTEVDNVDREVESKYWKTKRKDAMLNHFNESVANMTKQNAKNIALNIKNTQKTTTKQPEEKSYRQYLVEALLDIYDSNLIISKQSQFAIMEYGKNPPMKKVKKERRIRYATLAFSIATLISSLISIMILTQ